MYVWYHGNYVKITMTHHDFVKVIKNHCDFNIRIDIPIPSVIQNIQFDCVSSSNT